ncbi:unnamed protein product [Moneuplotes crassus]|uniref:Uncharacterized protein n=1 Tax=Euplotes crassus TaxID=5936 RepID=A0AAD1U246_EUPCR|nr:unnamed protein product [Moneuplotes crassus]
MPNAFHSTSLHPLAHQVDFQSMNQSLGANRFDLMKTCQTSEHTCLSIRRC